MRKLPAFRILYSRRVFPVAAYICRSWKADPYYSAWKSPHPLYSDYFNVQGVPGEGKICFIFMLCLVPNIVPAPIFYRLVQQLPREPHGLLPSLTPCLFVRIYDQKYFLLGLQKTIETQEHTILRYIMLLSFLNLQMKFSLVSLKLK